MPLNTLFIEDYQIEMSIGIHDHEKQAPQKVSVSVELDYILSVDSVDTDLIDNVPSYSDIVSAIRNIGLSKHYNLVETLAETLAQTLLTFKNARAVRVKIAKFAYREAKACGCFIERKAA